MNNPGWAYIYQLSADGSHYELEQELESPVGNNSYFGASVGIREDKVIVGADGYRKSRFFSALGLLIFFIFLNFFWCGLGVA